jgi:hypothetical protein
VKNPVLVTSGLQSVPEREFIFFKRSPQGFKASKSIKIYIFGHDLLLSTFPNPNPFEFLKNIILIKL